MENNQQQFIFLPDSSGVIKPSHLRLLLAPPKAPTKQQNAANQDNVQNTVPLAAAPLHEFPSPGKVSHFTRARFSETHQSVDTRHTVVTPLNPCEFSLDSQESDI